MDQSDLKIRTPATANGLSSWRRWGSRIAVGAAVATGAATSYVLAEFVIMPAYTGHGEVMVPDVVEIDMAKAKRVLADSGLVFVSDSTDWEYHPDLPTNTVISQLPRAYTVVKPGRRVRVRVSRGQQLFPVPDVVGKPLIQAVLQLRQAGYEVGQVVYVLRTTEDRSERFVLSQHPPARTRIPLNEMLGFEVSVIPEMPNLVGSSESSAIGILAALGLDVGTVERRRNADLLPGSVAEQSIPPGQRIRSSDVVDLTISRF